MEWDVCHDTFFLVNCSMCGGWVGDVMCELLFHIIPVCVWELGAVWKTNLTTEYRVYHSE